MEQDGAEERSRSSVNTLPPRLLTLCLQHRESISSRRRRQAEERLCQKAFQAATRQARRFGLPKEDAEDATVGFVLHILSAFRTGFLGPGGLSPTLPRSQDEILDRWLARCAINWTRGIWRSLRRHALHERCLTEMGLDLSDSLFLPDDRPTRTIFLLFGVRGSPPEVFLVRAELVQRFWQAVETAGLSARQWSLLSEHYFKEMAIAQIARDSDKKPNAVKQELWALRRRLQRALERDGIDATESAAYLAILATTLSLLGEAV